MDDTVSLDIARAIKATMEVEQRIIAKLGNPAVIGICDVLGYIVGKLKALGVESEDLHALVDGVLKMGDAVLAQEPPTEPSA